MFYCNTCATQNGWPTLNIFRSQGPCEICKVYSNCNDVPSRMLPPPGKGTEESRKALQDYLHEREARIELMSVEDLVEEWSKKRS